MNHRKLWTDRFREEFIIPSATAHAALGIEAFSKTIKHGIRKAGANPSLSRLADVVADAYMPFATMIGELLSDISILSILNGVSVMLRSAGLTYSEDEIDFIRKSPEATEASRSVRLEHLKIAPSFRGVAILEAKRVVSPKVFAKAVLQSNQWGMFSASELTNSEAEKLRSALVEVIATQPSKQNLVSALSEEIVEKLGPRLETVFRGASMTAYADGEDLAWENSPARLMFPYVSYESIHDARRREEHAAMETLGIEGSSIYRADDPVIQKYRPPWSWNCRCQRVFITLEQAASLEIPEAVEWLNTGNAPKRKTFVKDPGFPIDPKFRRPLQNLRTQLVQRFPKAKT